MKKILAIAYITLLSFTTFAQNYNQNVNFTRTTLLSGKTMVQDTSLYIKSGNDTLTVSNYSDATKLNTTAGNGYHFRKRTVPGYQFLFGDSANGSGAKIFSFIDTTLGSISWRSGLLADLTGDGAGNGANYWDADSIGLNSVVFNSINAKATQYLSSVYSSVKSSANGENSTIISSSASECNAGNTMIVNANSVIVNGDGSMVFGGQEITADGGSSTIINSNFCNTQADDFYARNIILGSEYCGTGDSTGLAFIVSAYQSASYGTHGVVLAGSWDTAHAYHEIVFGSAAVSDATGASNNWQKSDFLLHIGNAVDSTSKHDAFMQIKNGNIAIGDSLTLADKPTPGGPMLRVVGTVQVDSLLTLNNALDSAFIYALAPSKPAMVYCSDCSGNGITGRIVAYIGAAWRRLTFED